jgi:hypothetical protein
MPNPNTNFTAGQVLTAEQQNRFPRGLIGTSILNTDKSFTGIEDSGLTVTWTAESTRLYKISFSGYITSTGAGITFSIFADGSNNELKSTLATVIASGQANHSAFLIESGLSGSVTRKIRLLNQTGTGTLKASATNQASFMVEDVGPA